MGVGQILIMLPGCTHVRRPQVEAEESLEGGGAGEDHPMVCDLLSALGDRSCSG